MADSKLKHAKTRLALPDGGEVVLIDRLAKAGSFDEVNRNVYRVSSTGAVLWQISTDAEPNERQPFTNVYFEEGQLKAYCWNGGEYPVDLATGKLGQGVLLK